MFHVHCPNVVSSAFLSITGIQISEKHWVFVSFRIFWPWKWWHLKLWNTGTNCLLSVAWVQKTLLVIQAFRSVGTPNTALTLCITCGLAHTCSYQAHKRTGPPPTHYHLFTHLHAHSNSPFLLWWKTVHTTSWFKQAVYLLAWFIISNSQRLIRDKMYMFLWLHSQQSYSIRAVTWFVYHQTNSMSGHLRF